MDRSDGGIPRARRQRPASNDAALSKEEAREATAARFDKLRRNSLRRRARARGFELRHSAYGYSLFDAGRNRIEDRNDLTLDDVESYLAREA